MSNIDKHAVQAVADLKAGYTLGHADVEIIQQMALDAVTLMGELEAKDSRIGELEVIATDYGMKFQRAQDALKHQSLLHKTQMEAAEKRIADQRETLLAARSYVMQCARIGDAHANGVLQAIDRAAAGKGESS